MNIPAQERYTVTDLDTLARTMWGEARGEGPEGMTAVCCVVLNRLAVSDTHAGFWWGNTISRICEKPFQFSCWNVHDPNYIKLNAVKSTDKQFAQCLDIARQYLENGGPDITNGATHYEVAGTGAMWAKASAVTATIGHQIFYRPAEVPHISETETA